MPGEQIDRNATRLTSPLQSGPPSASVGLIDDGNGLVAKVECGTCKDVLQVPNDTVGTAAPGLSSELMSRVINSKQS